MDTASGWGSESMPLAIVDNDPMAVLALRAFVFGRTSQWRVIWTAESGRGAVERCARPGTRPAVLLVDLEMPGLDGPATVRAVRRRCPEVGMLLITAYVSPRSVTRAAAAGAQGIAFKDDPPESLRAWAREAAHGQRTGREPALFPTVEEAQRGDRRAELEGSRAPLSPREAEILRQCAQGLTTVAIARELALGETTVKTHLHRAMDKLGARSRAQAIAEAMRLGAI